MFLDAQITIILITQNLKINHLGEDEERIIIIKQGALVTLMNPTQKLIKIFKVSFQLLISITKDR